MKTENMGIPNVQLMKFEKDTMKVIYERRSIRNYLDKAVARNIIDLIIDAGRMAPSAINKQPWKFYVFTRKEDIKLLSREISKIVAGSVLKEGFITLLKTAKELLHFVKSGDFKISDDPIFHGAPIVILITADKDNEWADLDIGMCVQNMMLTAKAMGLASCPVGLGRFAEKTDLYSVLHMPKNETVRIALVIGYSDDEPLPKDRKTDNVTYL